MSRSSTRAGIRAAFEALGAVGVAGAPFASPEQGAATVAAWERVLGHLTDAALLAAVDGHLASDRGAWWPRPAELLCQVPAVPEKEEEEPWPMARLDPDVALRIHAAVADERAAGQWPTEAAMLGRFRELALAALREAA